MQVTNLSQFLGQLKSFEEEIDIRVVRFHKAVTLMVLGAQVELGDGRSVRVSGLIPQSPVDTGRFRGNWFVTVAAPGSQQTDATGGRKGEPPGADDIAKALTSLAALTAYGRVFIQNTLPYAEVLNQGHSKQAPAGFVELSVQNVARALKAAA